MIYTHVMKRPGNGGVRSPADRLDLAKRGTSDTGLWNRTCPEIIGHSDHRRTTTSSLRVEYGTIPSGPATDILDKTCPLSRFSLGPLMQSCPRNGHSR
jgi:hypothetical protein